MGPMPIRTQLLKIGWVRTQKKHIGSTPLPVISKAGGNASHGSHRLVAPTRVTCVLGCLWNRIAGDQVKVFAFWSALHLRVRMNNSEVFKFTNSKGNLGFNSCDTSITLNLNDLNSI